MSVKGRWFRQVRFVLHPLVVHELTELVTSLRYRVIVSLVVALMSVSAVLYASRYRGETETLQDALEHYGAALEGATVRSLALMAHPAFKPPWKLAFLADGEQSNGFDIYRHTLSTWEDPELATRDPARGRWTKTEPLDWLFVNRALISLAAFLLGYDAVCGRRQRRRLRLILSYSCSRAEVLTAKLAALWTCIAAPLVAGALFGSGVLALYGNVRFQAHELAKIGLTVLLSLWSAALFALMALVVSIVNRAAENSIVAAAVLWLTAVVVIPASSGLAAQLIRPVPSHQEVARQVREVRHQLVLDDPDAGSWRKPELAAADGYASERRSAAVEIERYERQETLRRELVRRQLAQVALARNLAALSPVALLQDLTERLVGTGPYRDRRFVEQAWAFREELAAHVEKLDRRDPKSPHLFFFPNYLSGQPAAAGDVPRFVFAEASLREGTRAALGRLLALTAWTAALAALAYAAFARWEMR